jgi:hypothetical protein
MSNVIQFPQDEVELPDSASLADLCMASDTRCFILGHDQTRQHRYFACVALPGLPRRVALYSQLDGEGGPGKRFYFEAEIEGHLPEAVGAAIQLLGGRWSQI